MQEKAQQAKILSMGTKRVLDEEAALSDDDDREQSDPIDVFNPPVKFRTGHGNYSCDTEPSTTMAYPILHVLVFVAIQHSMPIALHIFAVNFVLR